VTLLVGDGDLVTCTWTNRPGSATGQWYYNGAPSGGATASPLTFSYPDPEAIDITFVAGGQTSNKVTVAPAS